MPSTPSPPTGSSEGAHRAMPACPCGKAPSRWKKGTLRLQFWDQKAQCLPGQGMAHRPNGGTVSAPGINTKGPGLDVAGHSPKQSWQTMSTRTQSHLLPQDVLRGSAFGVLCTHLESKHEFAAPANSTAVPLRGSWAPVGSASAVLFVGFETKPKCTGRMGCQATFVSIVILQGNQTVLTHTHTHTRTHTHAFGNTHKHTPSTRTEERMKSHSRLCAPRGNV